MKFLKIIIYSLLGILSVYLVSNFFFDEKFKVSTSIEIESSPFIVYEQINNFDNWVHWDPWLNTDTTIVMSYSEQSSGVGASRSWDSEHSGNGKMEITHTEFIKQLDFGITIDDYKPFYASFYLESLEKGVKVSWENSGKLPFLARIFGPIMCKMMKGDHIKGLAQLKEYCESIPSNSGEVNVKEWKSQKIIAVNNRCTSSEISSTLAKSYNDIFMFLAENGIMPTQSPFAQYHSFPQKPGDNDEVILTAGTFIEVSVDSVSEPLILIETKSSLTAQAIHKGDYQTVYNTHYKIQDFCKANNYTTKGTPYEIYLSDPQLTPNVADWETLVVYEIE